MQPCFHLPNMRCPNCQHVGMGWAYPLTPLPSKSQKCDICGSTAIDHTEQQCQLNRMKKPIKSREEKKTK